ncbi:hypothetical protein [Bartonella sp. MR168JLCBS]|uniref:hypothetical protein n=1 Tax=Bartonella sp. MR168JLCBS TaxID=3243556 RepID=UPI0035CE924A
MTRISTMVCYQMLRMFFACQKEQMGLFVRITGKENKWVGDRFTNFVYLFKLTVFYKKAVFIISAVNLAYLVVMEI